MTRDTAVYTKLRDRLSVTPMGAPEGDDFIEILTILFTPEEARLALVLPFIPAPLKDIARAAELSVPDARRIVDAMSDKGLGFLIDYKDESYGMLVDVVPGIYEFPIMKGTLDIDYDRLKELWRRYHHNGWGDGKPLGGVMPLGRVLPVEETITPTSTVLTKDSIEHYIRSAPYLSVSNCSCRTTIEACDRPREVCLGVGVGAKYLAERGIARLIDVDEALEIVRIAHEAGLVSVSSNSTDRVSFICHCCPCCCGQLAVATVHGRYDLRPVGTNVAVLDEDSCTACGVCEDICPMDAVAADDGAVDPDRCIGCGLCVAACPTGAITLVPREPAPDVPPTMFEWGRRAAEAKGTLDEYMKELTVPAETGERTDDD
jgi:ferredoxin